MRFQNWPERLDKIIQNSSKFSFKWGEHDCCLFAANVVFELTGDDYGKDFRNIYKSRLGATRIIKKRGGIKNIVSNVLEEIPVLTAQRGDVVLMQTSYGETLTICVGEYCVAPGSTQLERISTYKGINAWRIK